MYDVMYMQNILKVKSDHMIYTEKLEVFSIYLTLHTAKDMHNSISYQFLVDVLYM